MLYILPSFSEDDRGWSCHAEDKVFPADLSWSNSLALGAAVAYKVYPMVRDDLLGAKEVKQADGDTVAYGLKVEKLVTASNVQTLVV